MKKHLFFHFFLSTLFCFNLYTVNLTAAIPDDGNVRTFIETTNVTAGNLTINNYLGSHVFVSLAGTISGTGTILGNLDVSNGAIIAPGNHIGQLNILGNYSQSNATYLVQINGLGQSSLINVGNSTTLGPDAKLAIVSIDGGVRANQPYPILHSDVGLNGIFSNLTFTNPLFVPTITYDPFNAYLSMSRPFSEIAANGNQQAVIDQLESIIYPTPAQTVTLTLLTALPANQAQKSLEQMSGEIYTNNLLINELASRKFIRRLFDPIRPMLSKIDCFEDGDYYRCYECDGLCYAYGDPLSSQKTENDFNTWLNVGGGQSILKHDHNAGGFKLGNVEVSLGGHAFLNECWTFGIGVGYEYDYTHFNIGGKGNSSTALIGLYSLYRPKTFYLLCDLIFGYNQTRIKRSIDFGELHFQATGKPKAYQGSFYAELGKNFHYGILNFQPFFGVEVIYYNSNKFSEGHADVFELRFKSKNATSSSSRLGVHFSSEGPGIVSFDFDIAWQCRFSSASNTLKAQFKDFGSIFTVHGVSLSRNSFDAEALISAQLNKTWSLYTEFSGQQWERAGTYSITGGVMAKW